MPPVSHPGIAIVDDEKSYVDMLAVSLAECFLNPIHTYTDPTEFLTALPRLKLGLVVTDYHMPKLNGVELIEKVRDIRPGLPFLIITGQGINLVQQNLVNLPELQGVLLKPFGWRKLATEILRVSPAAPRR